MWIAALAIMVAVTPLAAERHVASDSLPAFASFMRLDRGLFTFGMIAAQLGIVAVGAAVLAEPSLPDLLGWATVAAAALVLLHLGATGDTLPGSIHVIPAALGIVLLR